MKKVKSTSRSIPEVKRTPGYFNIKILGPDGKVRGKSRMNKKEACDFYFIGLDKNLQTLREKFGNIDDTFAQGIFDKYKNIYSKYKFKYQYVDSYGHLWEDKYAKIPDKWILEYLKNKINESNNVKITNNN